MPRSEPTLIQSLKNRGEKIAFVSCGCKHVICKSSLGKVYTWYLKFCYVYNITNEIIFFFKGDGANVDS